jgi:hypothetical protein
MDEDGWERYGFTERRCISSTSVKRYTITICVQVSRFSKLVSTNSDQCSAIVPAIRSLGMTRRNSSTTAV